MKYIRKSGVIFLGVVILIFILLNIFFTDRWLENQLEKAGSNLVGAKVEIDGLDVSLLKTTISWKRIQVTHPEHTMKNMIETGYVEFKLSPSALLKKKVVIESMKILNIRTFTDRKTDGRLPKKAKPKSEKPSFFEQQFAFLISEVKKAPAFEFISDIKAIKPKDIIDQINFGTPTKFDSIKNVVYSEVRKFESDLASLREDVNKLKEIETNLKGINPSAIKTLNDLKSTYETVDGSIKQIKEIKSRYEAKLNEIRSYPNKVNQLKDELYTQIKMDLESVKNFAKLPDISTLNLVKYLIGPKLFSYYLTYSKYSDIAEKYVEKVQSLKPEKEKKPPRLKGQDIHFVKEQALPNFWLKRCVLSGETNAGFSIQGEISNVSSQPKLIGQPTNVVITGIRPDKAKFELNLTLDFRHIPSNQSLNFKIEDLPISDFNFDHSIKYLPVKVENSRGNITFNLFKQGLNFKSNFQVVFFKPSFVFQTFVASNIYEEKLFNVIKNTFGAVNAFDVNGGIEIGDGGLKVSLSSSLDRQLTLGFKEAVGREIEQLKREAEAIALEKLEKYKKEFYDRIEVEVKKLTQEFEGYSLLVGNVEKLREEKLKELDKEIKNRGSKILENIFKR